MLEWDVEKKWLLISQDPKAEQLASGRKTALDDKDPDAPPPLINVLAEKAGEMWSATWEHGSRRLEKHRMSAHPGRLGPPTNISPSSSTGLSTTGVPISQPGPGASTFSDLDRYSPEFFIRKFMEADLRAVTPALVDHLTVNLRTRPIE